MKKIKKSSLTAIAFIISLTSLELKAQSKRPNHGTNKIKVFGALPSSTVTTNAGTIEIIRETVTTDKMKLPQAIQTALDKNPKTQANEMRLKAEFERLNTQKQAAFLPRFGMQAMQDINDSSKKSGNINLNWNIFNSFSDYYRLQAQECNYKKQEAQYNSTDTFIKNTSGQIAGLVANYFLNLVNSRTELVTLANTMQFLEVLGKAGASTEQLIQIENMKNSYQVRIDQVNSNLAIAEQNYKYIVTEPAPEALENLEETIQSIKVPVNSDEAYEIGLEKSPEILTAKLGLLCLQLGHKATQALQRGVRVDVSAGTTSNFQGQRTNTGYIVISKSFGADTFTAGKSELHQIEAARLDLDGSIDDLKNNLFVNYKQLEGRTKAAQSYENNFKRIEKQIQDLLKNGRASKEQIDLLLNLIGAYHGNWMNMSMTKQEIINLKFSIQRNIGILFETTIGNK